jgi:lycopene beta-cyclase
MTARATSFDLILVGGGLQSGLIALACLERRPDLRMVIIERGAVLGGNHTWSFHTDSIPEAARRWFEPLVEHRWPRYQVRFPDLVRTVEQGYATCSSARFAEVVSARVEAAPNASLLLDVEVLELGPRGVRLADGTLLEGELVVDARGPLDNEPFERSGFQKFVGLELELDREIDASTALLMDATVEQLDAFRFVYILPFSTTRALVEDTYFANDAILDRDAVRQRVLAYLAQRGLGVREILWILTQHRRFESRWDRKAWTT